MSFLDDFRFPFGAAVKVAVDFVTQTFAGFFDVISVIFKGMYEGVDFLLASPPSWVIILIALALAYVTRGWRMVIGTAIGFLFIVSVNQWSNAMNTMALVIVASVIAIIISIPVGILSARSRTASTLIRPVLDFLQTMPAFVYLIPAVILFRVGVVPGIVATILFALAPGVRLTDLGIRGVDKEVIEAGQAFGASPWRVLRQIQFPLALPSIMAGINQIIMLSLSMVVIAGMVGAPGLGKEIVGSLNSLNIGLGAEAGLAVVIIAMFLDRITASFGQKKSPLRDIRAKRASKGPDAGTTDTPAVAESNVEEERVGQLRQPTTV